MSNEIKALEVNNTWSLQPLPPGKKAIGCKWVYKVKYKVDGTVERFKARLLPRGILKRRALIILKHFHLLQSLSL